MPKGKGELDIEFEDEEFEEAEGGEEDEGVEEAEGLEEDFDIDDAASVASDDQDKVQDIGIMKGAAMKNMKKTRNVNSRKSGGVDDSEDEADLEDGIGEVDEVELLDEADEVETGNTVEAIEKREKLVESAEKKPSAIFKKVIEIAPGRRKTSNYLTRFEMAELLSIRTQQISEGSIDFVEDRKLLEGITDPKKIAELEFSLRRCPLRLRRFIGVKKIDGVLHEYIEYFDVNLMMRPALGHLY